MAGTCNAPGSLTVSLALSQGRQTLESPLHPLHEEVLTHCLWPFSVKNQSLFFRLCSSSARVTRRSFTDLRCLTDCCPEDAGAASSRNFDLFRPRSGQIARGFWAFLTVDPPGPSPGLKPASDGTMPVVFCRPRRYAVDCYISC